MFVFYLSNNLLALTRHHPLPAAKATWDMGDGARDCHTSPHSSQMNRVSAETPHSVWTFFPKHRTCIQRWTQ